MFKNVGSGYHVGIDAGAVSPYRDVATLRKDAAAAAEKDPEENKEGMLFMIKVLPVLGNLLPG